MFPNTNQKHCQTGANAYAIHGPKSINIKIPTNLVAKPSPEHCKAGSLKYSCKQHLDTSEALSGDICCLVCRKGALSFAMCNLTGHDIKSTCLQVQGQPRECIKIPSQNNNKSIVWFSLGSSSHSQTCGWVRSLPTLLPAMVIGAKWSQPWKSKSF